jgi:nucleotide-binding universal stress UspA family protein
MLKIERILCPVDFSDASGLAYDYAESFARRYDSALYVEHVIEPVGSLYAYYSLAEATSEIREHLGSQARTELQKFISAHLRNGKLPEAVIEEAPIMEGILEFARQKSIDLIVMGTHGRRGMDRFLLGSVTEKVLRKSKCPVLAVRKTAHRFTSQDNENDEIDLRRIVICTDFSEASRQALNYALSLAMEFNADLTLLHVLENIPDDAEIEELSNELKKRMGDLIPAEAQDWCGIKYVVRLGRPYQEILQLALETEADLVVMGVRGRNALDLAVFGSTTHRVIQMGSCPVLAVHVK